MTYFSEIFSEKIRSRKKLNFYFRPVIKKSPNQSAKMSFKDELTATVNSFRKNIKTKTINGFINRLKESMRWTAEKGETTGAIALRINFMDDDEYDDEEEKYEYAFLRRLNCILLTETVDKNLEKNLEELELEKIDIYEWLLKQISKIGVFDDIYIGLNDKFEMEYHWKVEEE